MRSKKILLVSSLVLAIAAIAVSSASLLAKPPKAPPPIPVTATYRDDPADALRSDGGGSYATSLPGGLVWGIPGPLCYHETTLIDADTDCLEGNPPDDFSMCGEGEIVVYARSQSFLEMLHGASQPGVANARIMGNDNLDYFVRFWPDYPPEPNCSTEVTITRIDATHWEIEGFGDDVARVRTRTNKGREKFTTRGHYFAPFKISLSQP
jgi:hypothetical protein